MSEARSYDLVCKPWIPVVWRNDACEPNPPRVGIREALKRAREIKCISHTAPFIEFGLYRLLIMILLDAYSIAGERPTIGKMRAILESRKFNAPVLGRYFDTYARRFDLWSAEYPFLQMPMPSGTSEYISKMIAPVPSGTKIAFWHHYTENETRLSEEEVARELCAVTPFCFDYAPKDICTIGGDPPLYVLVLGNSLFETIVFNLPRPSGRVTVAQEMKCGPTWRCPVEDPEAIPHAPTLTQGWTWPVRRIKLQQGEGSGGIVMAANKAGAGKTAAKEKVKAWRDPNAATITDAKGIRHIRATDLVPVFARSSGQGDQNPMLFWRDLIPMFLVGSEGDLLKGQRVRARPEVVTNAIRLCESELFGLAVYGFVDKGGKNNKVFRTWFRSLLNFPLEVARDNRLSARAIASFKTTQDVADTLQTAVRILQPPTKASKNKRLRPGRAETDTLVDFWQTVELLLTRSYLGALANNGPHAEANLRAKLRRTARRAFGGATDPHRRTADGLFRIANANNWLERRLAQLLPK
jgi:hypothetical protein